MSTVPSLVLRLISAALSASMLVEIIQLIQAQDADFPGALVEQLAFVDQQLAADDFVARGGVAAEIDAPDVILLLFVELHGHIDDFRCVVEIGFGSAVKSMKPYSP